MYWDRKILVKAKIGSKFGVVNFMTFDSARLHIAFDIDKSDDSEPNTATVSIYNMDDVNRQYINANAVGYSTIEIYAGYAGNIGLIYSGDIMEMKDQIEGADVLTTFSMGTGFNANYAGEISKSFPAGTSKKGIIATVAGVLQQQGQITGLVDTSVVAGVENRGLSISDSPMNFLKKYIPSLGAKVTNDDGVLKVSNKVIGPTSPNIYFLNAESGMIGFPEQLTITKSENPVINEAKMNGEHLPESHDTPTVTEVGYKITTLLDPNIVVGGTVVVTCKRLYLQNIPLIVTKIRYIGSNFGTEFYSQIEAMKGSDEPQ